MTRKLVPPLVFLYGCVGSLGALICFALALSGAFELPQTWLIVECIAALHALAACLTFQPGMRPPWPPLFAVTSERIRWARVLFFAATGNFVICVAGPLIADPDRYRWLEGRAAALILTSLLLQNTVYIAIHWAFRPENLFSPTFVEAISNPVGIVLKRILPNVKRR